MNYHITLVESDEGWAVWCDDLPGCCSQGDSRDEALANIRDAIREYLAARNENLNLLPGVHRIVREEVCV
jgi:predicted RNase H-like HicB family nuclease